MINIQFTIQDENEAKLHEMEEIAPGILDATLRVTARELKKYIRRNYLGGQVFNRRSGKMWEDFKHGRYKRATHDFFVQGPRILNIFSHSGGASIRPTHAIHIERKAYQRINSKGETVTGWRRRRTIRTTRDGFLRFPNVEHNPKFGEWVFTRYVHLPEKQVIEPASRSFNFQGTLNKEADRLYQKALDRRLKDAANV